MRGEGKATTQQWTTVSCRRVERLGGRNLAGDKRPQKSQTLGDRKKEGVREYDGNRSQRTDSEYSHLTE